MAGWSDGAGGLSRETMAGVGARIKSLRLRLDRSEQSFAALLEVEPDLVRLWERGEDIDRDALILIASSTDTEMEWLVAGLTPPEVEAIRRAAVAPAPFDSEAFGVREPISPRRVSTEPSPAPDGPDAEPPAGPVSPARTPSGRRPRGPCR